MSVRKGTPRLRLTCTVAGIALLLGAAGCGLEAPEKPCFETTFYLPLDEETYTGQDMADDLEAVEGDSAAPGPLTIRISEEIDPISLDDRISLDVEGKIYHAELSVIEFDAPSLEPASFLLGDLLPEGSIPPCDSAVIEAFSFDPPPASLGSFEDFAEVRFSSGSLLLTLTNNLPVPVGGTVAEGQALSVTMEDHSTSPSRIVATMEIAGELQPGEMRSDACDLAGRTVGNQLCLRVSGWSAGSGGAPVEISLEDGLDFTLGFHSIVVGSLTGRLPRLECATEASLEMDESISVTYAVIAEGGFDWFLQSELPIEARIFLEAPQIRRGTEPLFAEVILPPFGSANLSIELEGAVMDAGEEEAWIWNLGLVADSTGEFATVAVGAAIEATLADTEIRFETIRGVLDHIELEISPVEAEIEFPEGTEDVEFTVAEAEILVRNHAGLAADATLELWGETDGDTVRVPFSISIAAGSQETASEASVVLNESNSAILRLLTLRPEMVSLSGTVQVGDGQTEEEVTTGDYIDGSLTILAPMRLILETARQEGEAFEIEMDEDIRERVAENLLEVVVNAHVENHFPMDVEVKLHFARSEGALFVNDALILDADPITAGEIDTETGRVTSPTTSAIEMVIAEGDIDLFTEALLYGAMEIALLGDGENPVEIWSSDYVKVRGIVSFRYRVQ